MAKRSFVPFVAAAALLASACDLLVQPRSAPPASAAGVGPSAELTERAVRTLLPGLRFGADERAHTYREIRAVRVAGAHLVPAGNRHVVHYCVDYTSFAGEEQQTRCDLNVQVYALDSGAWVGHATGAGTIYRWQVLAAVATETPAAADGASQPEAAAAPDAE